jgi:hypothetical protein
LLIDSTCGALTPGYFHIADLFPLGLNNIIVLAGVNLNLVLTIVASKDKNFLGIIDGGEKVTEGGHLGFIGNNFFALLEDEEVVGGRTAK